MNDLRHTDSYLKLKYRFNSKNIFSIPILKKFSIDISRENIDIRCSIDIFTCTYDSLKIDCNSVLVFFKHQVLIFQIARRLKFGIIYLRGREGIMKSNSKPYFTLD